MLSLHWLIYNFLSFSLSPVINPPELGSEPSAIPPRRLNVIGAYEVVRSRHRSRDPLKEKRVRSDLRPLSFSSLPNQYSHFNSRIILLHLPYNFISRYVNEQPLTSCLLKISLLLLFPNGDQYFCQGSLSFSLAVSALPHLKAVTIDSDSARSVIYGAPGSTLWNKGGNTKNKKKLGCPRGKR